MTQHDDVVGLGIGALEGTADERIDTEHVEVIPRDACPSYLFGLPTRREEE